MIISLKTLEEIIALLDKLVATDKIERHEDAKGMVSFSPKPEKHLSWEFIVTAEGHTVLIDDVLNADEEDDFLDLIRFAGKGTSTIPGNKIAAHANYQIYNHILSEILYSIRYNKVKPDTLKMTLPTSNNGEEILVPRGFSHDYFLESASHETSKRINYAVLDLINFQRVQLKNRLIQREQRYLSRTPNASTQTMLMVIRNNVAQDEQAFIDNVNKQLNVLNTRELEIRRQSDALEKVYHDLPKSFMRKVNRGIVKTVEEADQKSEMARKSKKAASRFCEFSACMIGAMGLGFVMLPVGGILYGVKYRAYQKARREYFNCGTFFAYPAHRRKLDERMQNVLLEKERYHALLEASVTQTVTTSTTTSCSAENEIVVPTKSFGS